MSGIRTALEITDRMSYPLHSITSALDTTLNVFEDFKTSLGSTFDNSKIDSARISIDEANASIKAMEENIKNTNNENDKMPQKFANANSSASSLLHTLMGFSVIQKIGGLISGQFESAISRLDTMNNYPKVMSNLGISADQSNASIKVLSEGLKGLPTTLNDAVSSVQNFTSVNGSVGKSTKMFLALNNAILAGGGSTQVQQSALEQLSQSYAKGKPDMMEWRTAMTAMPAQLKQVAQAMGYIDTNALGEDLRAGKVSMNDFMNTFIELNENGVNGFQSFEEQARNATGGFATSIANAKSATTRGITSLIENINNGLSNAGFGTIQDIIQNVGNGIEKMLTNVGKVAGKAITVLSPALNLIKQVGSFISDNWSIIAPIVMGIVGALGAYYGAQLLLNTINGIATGIETVKTLATTVHTASLAMQTGATFAATTAQYGFNAALLACPLTWIIIAIIAVIAIIYAVIAAINKVTGKSISATGVIMGSIFALGANIWNKFIVPTWNAIAMLVNFFANCFKDPVASIKVLFAELTVWVLNKTRTMLEGIEYMINSIPGVQIDITSGLDNYISMLERGIQGIKDEAGLEDVMEKLSTINLEDAYSKGYDFGSNLGSNFGNSISETMDDLNLDDLISTAKDITDTAGNTSKIIDSLSGTEEDLKYLRDLAEQETVNRFTTAEITIHQTNHNTINSEMDIDGVVNSLTEGVNEAMEQAAEGDHE